MHRHLAHWPAYLALAWTLLAPLKAHGSLHRLIANVAKKARERSAHLMTQLPALSAGPIDPGLSAAIRPAIESFTSDVISKMVVICAVLRAVTSGGCECLFYNDRYKMSYDASGSILVTGRNIRTQVCSTGSRRSGAPAKGSLVIRPLLEGDPERPEADQHSGDRQRRVKKRPV